MKSVALVLFLAICTVGGVSYAQSSIPETEEQTNIRVYDAASSGVVSIRSAQTSGSGTTIDRQGLVLTSGHVVGRSSQVTVTLSDGRVLTGKVIGFSQRDDLALIRLDSPPPNLTAIPIAPATKPVQVGQRAFAIGNPFGRFANTLTTGIVSRYDPVQQIIQTTAQLNPGSSGGPLLNSDGELVGLNTAIFQGGDRNRPTGVGLAIASDRLRQFLADVQAGRIGTNPRALIPLVNGAVINSSLTNRDETLGDGSFFQIYELSGQVGEVFLIEMQSRQIDPYIVLFDPAGRQIAEDDDSGDGKNAQIVVELPMTGIYTLYANSYEAGKVGNFTLSLRSGRLLVRQQGRIDSDHPTRAIAFAGRSGRLVQIALTTSEFRPSIRLLSPSQRVLQSQTVANDQRRATMRVSLPMNGTYQVIVGSANQQENGSYELIIKELP